VWHVRHIDFFESPVVEELGETLARAHAHMVVAARANLLQQRKVTVENHFPALLTALPQIIGRVIVISEHARKTRANKILKPVHFAPLVSAPSVNH
jgi:hypothetical protein